MEPLLAHSLKGLPQSGRSIARWGEGRIHLRVSGYLTDSVPAPQYVTSARCLVLQSSKVLVQRDRSGAHVLPGGRIEPGEAPEAAMRREVLEETGWRLGPAQFLGFMRFRHLTPRPADYVYPYPDFIQLVYTAEALNLEEAARIQDGWEIGSEFLEAAEIVRRRLPAGQRLFLRAGIERHGLVFAS